MNDPALDSLRDIQGVYGSFVIGTTGALLGRDLPAIFEDSLLNELGPRVARLVETVGSSGENLKFLSLDYTEHKLHVKITPDFLVCVISGALVNRPALKLALNLVGRRFRSGAPAPGEIGATLMSARMPPLPVPATPARSDTLTPKTLPSSEPRRLPDTIPSVPARLYRGRPVS